MDYFPILLEGGYSRLPYVSVIEKYYSEETIEKQGFVSLCLGYNAAKIWNENKTLLPLDVYERIDGLFSYQKVTVKKFFVTKEVEELVDKTIKPNFSIGTFVSEFIEQIQYMMKIKSLKDTDCYTSDELIWYNVDGQKLEYFKSLYIYGMAYYIEKNDINVEEVLNGFYKETHYNYRSIGIEYLKKNVFVEYCKEEPCLYGSFDGDKIIERLLIDLKQEESNEFDFVIKHLENCFFCGLGFEMLYNINENEYYDIISAKDSSVKESVLERYKGKEFSKKDIELQCNNYIYVLLELYKEESSIELKIKDIIDAGYVMRYIGQLTGAYAIGRLLKDVDTRF